MERADCWEGRFKGIMLFSCCIFVLFPKISAVEHSLGRRWVGYSLGMTLSSCTGVPMACAYRDSIATKMCKSLWCVSSQSLSCLTVPCFFTAKPMILEGHTDSYICKLTAEKGPPLTLFASISRKSRQIYHVKPPHRFCSSIRRSNSSWEFLESFLLSWEPG